MIRFDLKKNGFLGGGVGKIIKLMGAAMACWRLLLQSLPVSRNVIFFAELNILSCIKQ